MEALGVVKYEVWRLRKACGVVKYEVWRLRKAFGVVKYEFWRYAVNCAFGWADRLALLSKLPCSIPEAWRFSES